MVTQATGLEYLYVKNLSLYSDGIKLERINELTNWNEFLKMHINYLATLREERSCWHNSLVFRIKFVFVTERFFVFLI